MSLIKAIQAAIQQATLRVGTPEVRAVRIYANNKKRNAVAPVEKLCRDLRETGPWPLEKKFHEDSIPWLKDLLFKKNGLCRNTPQALRFTARSLCIARELDRILFVGVAVLDSWKETKLTYAVFRAVDKSGDSFDFYYVPWQSSSDTTKTGLFPVTPMTEVL